VGNIFEGITKLGFFTKFAISTIYENELLPEEFT